MIVERIEYVVNATTRFVVYCWVQHWPLLLPTLWAVLSLWISFNLTGTVAVVTNAAVVITSFAGTVACLEIFRLERCFWMYALVFMGVGGIVFFINPELKQLKSALHLKAIDEELISRTIEAVLWTGIVTLLSTGLYFFRFRHRVSYVVLIKIPLTVFCMYLFLQPIFIAIWFDLVLLAYGIMGIPL